MASLKSFSKIKFLAALVTILIISLPALAHHGNAAYDDTRTVTVKGTVTQWLFGNPHSILKVNVTDESGKTVTWVMETENATSMFNIGWTREAIKVGDQITVTALPVKNGSPVGRIVDVVLADGRKLDGKARPKPAADSPNSNK